MCTRFFSPPSLSPSLTNYLLLIITFYFSPYLDWISGSSSPKREIGKLLLSEKNDWCIKLISLEMDMKDEVKKVGLHGERKRYFIYLEKDLPSETENCFKSKHTYMHEKVFNLSKLFLLIFFGKYRYMCLGIALMESFWNFCISLGEGQFFFASLAEHFLTNRNFR